MAGHSKWANIKHRKAAQDAKKGKVFTKLIRELSVAARQGGGEPDDNPRLRAAVDKALANNMTKDTIQRAIDRGAGNADGDAMEEAVYEGYGPDGVAVLVECLTDNRNRTVSDVRHAFSKHGGNLGTSGSVAFLFNKQGRLNFAADSDEETIMEAALEGGAEDVVTHDDGAIEVITTPKAFGEVKDALVARGLEPEHSEVGMFPETYSPIEDVEVARKVVGLFDRLEDLDDVQNVYSNADFADDVLAELH
ncbi:MULTISPECIES: YebC/PmpR family DNA-binding transcriptional regulator [Modicisalibacter]|uniref:YebC/PmpR family DNA-binding transcriptional regulator n=1 Tax=Modicisalibacter TaxID=574347 RepID=UPI00100C2893|nr:MULTISPECIES: YebC/PmpR family DNA-binding transcriptional regulator [Halomonadaceae]MBZ9556847.1 YebC/PmpR family DNA-binding transcriptional regulator [Modicisalibacter sp. R2A 31.J]MBZ9574679.1 YebC/PmpR family DNA-binding transcriptional regulator [Modicisalibacter sp. MOD 31.J]